MPSLSLIFILFVFELLVNHHTQVEGPLQAILQNLSENLLDFCSLTVSQENLFRVINFVGLIQFETASEEESLQ